MRVGFTLEQCWHRVPGGTAVAAVELARGLTGLGVELVGVAGRHRHPPPPEWAPPIEVRMQWLTRPPLYEAWHRLGRPRVERTIGPVDLVHATAIAVPPTQAPIVWTCHDLHWRTHPEHFTQRGVRMFERALAMALDRADLVLASSEATARDCHAAGFEPTRVSVVPLGATPIRPSGSAVAEVRSRLGLDRPYVMWTGTAEPRKNLKRLVEAWHRLGDDHRELVLVGPAGWREVIGDLTSEGPARVRHLGFLSAHDLAAVRSGADAVCVPSLAEGFGLPVLEAMAAGVPVVTSAGTATEEVAGDTAELVDPLEVDSIATGLGRLLSDDGHAADLARRAKERASEFTWARCARGTLAAYETLLGGEASGISGNVGEAGGGG